MNRTEIEQAVLKEIHTLPLDKVEATLNFILSLKNKPVKNRPLGLLKGKVDFAIKEDFKMTDEEFLEKQSLFSQNGEQYYKENYEQ